jgi:hypothetical protein
MGFTKILWISVAVYFRKSQYEILKNSPNFDYNIFFIWTHSEVEQSSLKVWDVKIKKYIMQTTVHFSHYFFLHPFLHMVCPNIGISHCTLSNNLVANILFWKRRKILVLLLIVWAKIGDWLLLFFVYFFDK